MKKEIKIALVAIAAIVILFSGMNFLKGISLFSEKNVYYARFSNINGLTANNPIFANGYQVGLVKDIQFDYSGQGDIIVAFSLNDKMHLPVGTAAAIESDFMGNVRMNIVLPTNNTPLPTGEGSGVGLSPLPTGEGSGMGLLHKGDTIPGSQAEGLMARAAALLPAVEQMLPKLDSILMSVNTLLADPSIARTLHHAERVTADLTTSTRQLNTLMANLNRQVPALMSKANGVLDNTQQLTQNLAAVDIDATMQKVDRTLANVEATAKQLSQPNGTLGLLMNDPSLYNRLNGTLNSAEMLLNDVREHPKRYINVSVFGRKSKE
ncbi:MAG: MCE family protein [Prevotella sp.]|nr:MCE family protein [Prevotella sp.]